MYFCPMDKVVKNIPSAITILNLVCGFMAILVADFFWSTILLLTALLFDVLDGMLARALHAQSALGLQLDSLADLVSFGVAPAYLYFLLSPSDEWWIKYLPACMIVAASGLRLGKFNLLPSSKDFTGLPTPANAFYYMGLFLCVYTEKEWIIELFQNKAVYFLSPMILGYMMHSKLKMFSLKSLSREWSKNAYHLAMLIICIVLAVADQFSAFVLVIPIYIILSLLYTFRRRKTFI